MITKKLQIRIANLSVDGKTATLGENYQVTKALEQRLVLVGCWMNSRVRSDGLGKVGLGPTGGNQSVIPGSPVHRETESRSSIPRDVDTRVNKLQWGVLEAPVDDPLQRRQDLTGLHLTCVTIDVRLLT